jgi:hypothetical protein
LGVVNRQQFFHSFEFNDQPIFDNDIKPILF